jgi:hypothetical protein
MICPWQVYSGPMLFRRSIVVILPLEIVLFALDFQILAWPVANGIKNFHGHKLRLFEISLFQPSLMIVGETRSLSYSGAPERGFTRVGSSLTRRD